MKEKNMSSKNKRRVVVQTFMSLDGIMQAPGGPEEDPTGGFVYGGWSVNYWDEMMMKIMNESLAKPYDLLLGRKTYEIFAAHWPFVKNDPDVLNQMAADRLNGATKYVVTKTLSKAEWQNSILIKNDIVNQIAKIKNQDGPEIQVHGSSDLVQTLLKHDLVDELRLWIFPVVLGTGKRLFGNGALSGGWSLVESKSSPSGVLIATYGRAGEIQKGSAALETPTEAEIARRKKMKEEG
jgi:dihydrofolate reductase